MGELGLERPEGLSDVTRPLHDTFRCSSCGEKHSAEKHGLKGVDPRPKNREGKIGAETSGSSSDSIAVSVGGEDVTISFD